MATSDRPYHHGNLRPAILARAEEILGEGGVDDLTLRGIARDLGVSHAAPSRHFEDRKALLDAVAASGYERLGNEVRAAIEGADGSFFGRSRAAALAYISFASANAALLDLMFASKHHSESDELALAAERSFLPMMEVITDAQESGELVAGDPKRIGTPLFAALQGLATMANSGFLPADELDQAISDTVAGVLDGLRPRRP